MAKLLLEHEDRNAGILCITKMAEETKRLKVSHVLIYTETGKLRWKISLQPHGEKYISLCRLYDDGRAEWNEDIFCGGDLIIFKSTLRKAWKGEIV